MLELLGGEYPEYIGLIFGVVGGAVQFEFTVVIFNNLGVVAGDDGVEAQCQGAFQQGSEFDAFVTAHTRVGCTPGGVFINEVFNHFFLEALGKVPGVIRMPSFQARQASEASSMVQQPREPVRRVPGMRRQCQVNTHDVVAGVNGGAAATAESTPPDIAKTFNFFIKTSLSLAVEFAVRIEDGWAVIPAFAAAWYTPGSVAITASISVCVVVWPKENRCDRAAASS